jgi:hypothetical protein
VTVLARGSPRLLNNREKGAIILSAPVARESALERDPGDDLIGHVRTQEDWDVVRFLAIAEADETHVIDTLAGLRSFAHRQGEPLHPARGSQPILD